MWRVRLDFAVGMPERETERRGVTMEKQEIYDALAKMRQWDEKGVAPCEDCMGYVQHVLEDVAPYAEMLGCQNEQHELQELSVKLGYPEDYGRLKKLLQESEMSCEMVFRTFSLPIRAMLDTMGIEYDLTCRMKSVYSIWRKMRNDGKEFDDVYDLFAVRIVYKPKPTVEPLPMTEPNAVDALPDVGAVRQWQMEQMDAEQLYCWRIYTVISMLYRIHPDRIKNWITHPKPSGYQALQLTVMGPDCYWVEVQIRSERMNYEAEHGKAAHWLYKQESKAV